MTFDGYFEPEDEYEIAKLKVIELTDRWPWLGPQINDQRLTWREIFKLVGDNI